jgi:hypothetical protein
LEFYLIAHGTPRVFISAGVVKFQAAQALADSVATFRLLPAQRINSLVLGLPPLRNRHRFRAYFASRGAWGRFARWSSARLLRLA